MRLRQLQYFLKVAETENVSQASRELLISQPSLSKSLNELETELAVPLFIRNGRSLKLNQEGRFFQERVSRALNLLNESVKTVKKINAANEHVITLCFENSTPLIPSLVKKIRQEIPGSPINLIQSGPRISETENLGFQFSNHPISGNINRLLIRENIVVAVSPDSVLAKKKQLLLSDIQGQDLIMTTRTPLQLVIETFLLSHGFINTKPAFITSDHATLFGLVNQNLGIAFVPERTWPGLDQAEVVLKHLVPEEPTRESFLSYHPSMIASPQLYQIESAIVSFFGSL